MEPTIITLPAKQSTLIPITPSTKPIDSTTTIKAPTSAISTPSPVWGRLLRDTTTLDIEKEKQQDTEPTTVPTTRTLRY